jgi:hypothetical protein
VSSKLIHYSDRIEFASNQLLAFLSFYLCRHSTIRTVVVYYLHYSKAITNNRNVKTTDVVNDVAPLGGATGVDVDDDVVGAIVGDNVVITVGVDGIDGSLDTFGEIVGDNVVAIVGGDIDGALDRSSSSTEVVAVGIDDGVKLG